MSSALSRVVAFLTISAGLLTLSGCFMLGEGRYREPLAYKSVSTFAGPDQKLGEPFGIAVRDGEVYLSDGEAGAILKLGPDGTSQVFASGLNTPSAIAFLPSGDLIVADTGSHTIKQVASSGEVSIVAGIENVVGSEDGSAHAATFNGPIGLAVNGDGTIYVADSYNDRIRVIRDGTVSTLSGNGRGFADGPSSFAKFDTPLGLAVWHDKLLVADSANRRVRVVEANGEVWTLAGTGDDEFRDGPLSHAGFVSPTAIATDGEAIFVADGNAIRVIGRRAFPFVETIAGDQRGYVDGVRSRFNRPSGLAVGTDGELFVADSDNHVIRAISDGGIGREAARRDIDARRMSASEFKSLQPPRWPYDPPLDPREVAGTLGEIRGEISDERKSVWFHNGLDIAGAYGEVTKFIRTETVLDPHSAENFATARELLRLPSIGYIHLRLGRDRNDRPFADKRFQFDIHQDGGLVDVRVRRGARFLAGDSVGTLNSQNHVHLIAGPPGGEINALAALVLPGIADSIAPVIERVELLNEDWSNTADGDPRLTLGEKRRVVVEAYDRMDGNAERRRLGVYRLGYQILASNNPLTDVNWTIVFDRMPSNDAVRFAYAPGSRSGATGQTKFRYTVSNRVADESFSEGFLDSESLGPGLYTMRAYAADYFGNTTWKDFKFEILPHRAADYCTVQKPAR